MKRFHLHISVEDLNKNVQFYSQLFNADPTILKEDYAKWAVDDPALNFAISTHSSKTGLDHVGIQTETDDELRTLRNQLETAGMEGVAQDNTACCYAKSDKYWVQDPQGIAWETFHSLESVPVFSDKDVDDKHSGCCIPSSAESNSNCC